jgi:hypothetical protein
MIQQRGLSGDLAAPNMIQQRGLSGDLAAPNMIQQRGLTRGSRHGNLSWTGEHPKQLLHDVLQEPRLTGARRSRHEARLPAQDVPGSRPML